MIDDRRWFLVCAICGHAGYGHYKEKYVCLYASDIYDVLSKYWQLPSIKRSISGYPFPSIRSMGESEVKNLERIIVEEGKVSLYRAKETFYFPGNNFWDIVVTD